MEKKRPTILVTNDDGITAPGLRTLIKVMRKLGDVVVVAPDRPRSGQGHAITVSMPLRVSSVYKEEGYQEYRCNGTPVDCVKLGVQIVLRRTPDLLVSGINHGSNASINVVYSGTMAAVIEAAIDKIPAIGFSLDDYEANADFSHTEEYVEIIAREVLEKGLPEGTCLNVNFPVNSNKPLQGVKVCRQSLGSWKERFDERTDPRGRDYFWITGVFSNPDHKEGTDTRAMEQNYVSVVPMKFDLTSYEAMAAVQSFDFKARLNSRPVMESTPAGLNQD
ncbi:MAG: 5'/3'-nucleotidase SurE [Bacteroidales bacterium]|nr:5'/3'-nucleotidase SurE [Bacteroidales bacterium]